MIEIVTLGSLPTRYQVEVGRRDEAEVAAIGLRQLPGVTEVALGPGDDVCAPELAALTEACAGLKEPMARSFKVWLAPEAGPEVVEAVAGALHQVPDLAEATYIDRDQVTAEFEAFYADQPETAELVEPSQLPTRFDVVTTALVEEQSRRFADEVEQIAGVDRVDLADPVAVACQGVNGS